MQVMSKLYPKKPCATCGKSMHVLLSWLTFDCCADCAGIDDMGRLTLPQHPGFEAQREMYQLRQQLAWGAPC